MKFARDYLEDLKKVLDGLDLEAVDTAIKWFKEARDNGRLVLVCGNGGSASIASHLVVDFLKGASYGHASRFKIISLADSLPTVTAYANDVAYDRVFAEQLRNFAQEGDILLAISGSGNSRNVLEAVKQANEIGCRTIGLSKAEGGALGDIVQLRLSVPGDHMGRLEDGFMVMPTSWPTRSWKGPQARGESTARDQPDGTEKARDQPSMVAGRQGGVMAAERTQDQDFKAVFAPPDEPGDVELPRRGDSNACARSVDPDFRARG